jgi:hypothetical protein
MTKTTIRKTANNEVTVRAVDPLSGEAVTWTYWVPRGGGYVREGTLQLPTDPQVCVGLGLLGTALTATDGDDLLRVIRSEWRAHCRAVARLS